MPNTAIQGLYNIFSCTNLNQTHNYSEGNPTLSLTPMVFTASSLNYTRVYTLTMTISAPSQAASVSIVSGVLNNMPFTRVGNVYTLSSQYTLTTGVVVNNWEYFKLAIKNISLAFANSDLGESFTITNSLTDGTFTLTGNIIVTTMAQADVTGNIQTINVPMGMNGTSLTTAGGTNVVIADANQANKTYRVTYTVNDATNASGTSNIYLNNSALGQSLLKTFTVSGTQAYINSVIASYWAYNGLYFKNYSPNFYGQSTISYLQEVLTTTEPGVVVPYNQEAGLLTLNTTYTAPFTIGSDPTYTEDSSVTFSLGTITDISADSWASETCGTGIGVNCFTVTATVTGSFSGTNPVKLTYSGDSSVDDTVTFTGTKSAVNALLASVQLIPPADYIGLLPIAITVTRGNTPVTLFTGNITATCTSAHNDFEIVSGVSFALGASSINLGSITDLATSKNYTVTLDATVASSTRGSLTDSTSLGTWNGTGGVNGFGRLTITGTKAQLNSSLAALTYTTVGGTTLADVQTFIYTQTQNTNSISQGTKNISFANSIIWQNGNGSHSGQPAFVYDQDVATTWNLATLGGIIDTTTTYTCKLVFNTPLSTANLGSVTWWIKETDYIWTLTGVRSTLNSALAAVVFVPPAQLVSNFTLDIKVYNGATLVADTSAISITKSVYINQLVNNTWTASALTYDQDNAATWSNLATLNSNFGSGTYKLRLTTSVATGGTIAGWTTIDSTTFEKTDTKANLQTALNTVVFGPSLIFVSNFTFNLEAYRSLLLLYTSATLSNSKSITKNISYSITPNASALTYNQDNTVTFNFATLSSNFNNSSTYTITLTSSVTNIGTLTGWTTASSTTFTKTDTGANLTTALAALQFVPTASLVSNFTLTAVAVKSSTTIATSTAKTINVGVVYGISFVATAQTFDQDRAKTFTNVILPNAAFNNANTYTFTITTSGSDVGTFTGWTKTSATTHTKTDTGANLIAACNSLVYTSPINLVSTFSITVAAARGILTVASSTAKTITLTNRYILTATTLGLVYHTTSTNFTNIGSLNSWFVDTDTYVFTLEIFGVSGISVTGSGWTTVTGTKISATGTKTAINALLTSGITVSTPLYTNTDLTYSISITKTGTLTTSGAGTYIVANKPYLQLDQYKPEGGYPYDYVGYNRLNATSYVIPSPYDIYNRDLRDTLRLNNIPADSSVYQLVVTVDAPSSFSVASAGLTWTQESTTVYVSNSATIATLTSALSDLRLLRTTAADADSFGGLITVSLRAAAPFVETFTPTRTLANNGAVNAMETFITNGIYFYSNSGAYRAAWVGQLDTSFNLVYAWIDPSLSYTFKINMGGPNVAVSGWALTGSYEYSKSGDIATLNTALLNCTMTATATTARFVTFSLYYGSTLMGTTGYQIRTN